ncbi:MAG: hypothetical protein AB7I38_02635 [Dehalococcoidia bacterium]
MAARECQGLTQGQQPCRQAPLRDALYCFWHDPGHATEAAEARRLGGLRRRRESTLAGAFDFDGLGSTQELRRLLEVAAYDLLGLENSIARARALTSIVQVGARLLETGELEERLAALEAAVARQ